MKVIVIIICNLNLIYSYTPVSTIYRKILDFDFKVIFLLFYFTFFCSATNIERNIPQGATGDKVTNYLFINTIEG